MNTARKAAVAMLLALCAAGLVWMFRAKATHDDLVNNAQVVGALAGVVALALAAVVLWPKRTRSAGTPTAAQLDTAVEYLATETLRYWQQQAKDRRITTPSPAVVRWRWAGPDMAAPSWDLDPALLTDGAVTRLREQLYQPDTRNGPQRIVILGGPGAGKTTGMLLLLIDVLNHRLTDSPQPVPVWLTLGGWNPDTTSLRDWATQTLRRDYPSLAADAYGGSATATELLRTGRVALFCDGLDEMADALRARALQRIDQEAQGLRVVLTSRPDEYTTTLTYQNLWDAAVVEVLPVDGEHARDFLLRQQRAPRRRAWQRSPTTSAGTPTASPPRP
jgi:predicted NACHT family NTPase